VVVQQRVPYTQTKDPNTKLMHLGFQVFDFWSQSRDSLVLGTGT